MLLPATTPFVKMRLERPAGRDKREIKNLDSAEYSQSESGGYLKSKKGYTSSLKISIPRFLPVENSLQLCYDRKQRIFPKIDSEEGNGSCVKVVF